MLLAGVGLLLAALIITRILRALRIAKSFAWFLPVYIVLSGGLWTWLTMAKQPGLQNLHALVQFLLMSSAFVWIVYLAAKVAIPEEAQRTRAGLPPLIRNLIVLVVGLLGLFILLTWSFPGLSLTPVFLTSGVLSIIIGLAVQNLLSNLLAGVVLGVQRPFKVGEWIQIGDLEGEVVEINWRATIVRTRQGDRVEFPNGLIAKERMINYDRAGLHQIKLQVGVGYETPPGLVASALFEAGSRVEGLLASPPREANLKEFQDSALFYELCVWVDNYACVPAVESELRKEIWYAFKRHGITIPFPQRDVHMRQVVPHIQGGTQRHGRLIAAAGLPHGTRFALNEDRITIGRDPQSRICLNDPHVSNDHAVIERQESGFLLRDLESRHGTLLNGAPTSSALLQQGDEIRIGPFALIFESNVAPRTP